VDTTYPPLRFPGNKNFRKKICRAEGIRRDFPFDQLGGKIYDDATGF
jgi:hypothetical protein